MTHIALRTIHLPFSFAAPISSSAAAARHCPACKRLWRRQLSSTPCRDMTRLRAQMFAWLNSRGKAFLDPVEQNTNYLTDYDSLGFRLEEGDVSRGSQEAHGLEEAGQKTATRVGGRNRSRRPRQPFPLNDHFISQPILSEQLRKEIWRRVKVDGKSIRIVSVELGVEMRRVAAVVRLMEIEKQWRAEVSSHSPLSPFFRCL